MPTSITYSTGKSAAYTYDATGRKLRVAYTNPSSMIDYCGNMIYEAGTLKQVLVDGGYIAFNGSTPTYQSSQWDRCIGTDIVLQTSTKIPVP